MIAPQNKTKYFHPQLSKLLKLNEKVDVWSIKALVSTEAQDQRGRWKGHQKVAAQESEVCVPRLLSILPLLVFFSVLLGKLFFSVIFLETHVLGILLSTGLQYGTQWIWSLPSQSLLPSKGWKPLLRMPWRSFSRNL